MLSKKLILGSLAGATMLASAVLILPNTAQAVVSGQCVNCHTMHNSEGGSAVDTAGANELLLRAGGCMGCHGVEANEANGRGATTLAPQVGTAASGTQNAGGYFNVDADSHSVGGSIAGLVDTSTAPGGSMAAGTGFTCQSCHTDAGGTGGHHNAAAGYRMLGTVDVGTINVNYAQDGTDTVYNISGTDINSVCAACHPDFHGTTAGNQSKTGGVATDWVRHPTGITAAGYPAANALGIPQGVAGEVLCISCHRPHGSGAADLVRFSYTANSAGDGSQSVGCETCHGSK